MRVIRADIALQLLDELVRGAIDVDDLEVHVFLESTERTN